MKKLIVLFLAGLVILAFGATAYAQKLEFRASGFIDAQTAIEFNVPGYVAMAAEGLYGVVNPNFSINSTMNVKALGVGPYGTNYQGAAGYNKNGSSWESRAHLKFDAVMGPNLSGTIYFEIDSASWGSAYPGTTANGILNTPFSVWAGNGREANNFGAWTTDRTAVEVKNVYFDVGLPYFGIPWPITVRVGAQPIGIRPAMLLYSDGTGVTAGIKADPFLINPIYAKAVASPDFSHQDSDVYGLQVNAKVSTITVGGYGLLYRMGTYPFWQPDFAAYLGTPASTVGNGLLPVVAGTMKSNMWWLGAYAEGKAGPVDLNFDLVWDFGKVTDLLTPGTPHVTYNGWAGRLNVEYPWEKFKFGLTGMYASGQDTHKTDPTGTPGALTTLGTPSKNANGFVIPPGSEQAPIDSESVVMYGMEAGASGGFGIAEGANYWGLNRGGFGGTWFIKAYTSYKIAPWYKLTAQALYIGDTTQHGTTFGDALKPNGQFENGQFIGLELDLLQDIQIYRNLRFWIGLGYMFAGNAMKISNAFDTLGPIAGTPPNFTAGPSRNYMPENPWAFRTRLIYTF